MSNRDMWEQENRELRAEIERLRRERDEAETAAGVEAAENRRLRQRIEELESTWGNTKWRLQEALRRIGEPEEFVILKVYQIDAAVAIAINCKRQAEIDDNSSFREDAVLIWKVLGELGIVRCPDVSDGCGGTGMSLGDTCPDCNGHGWVKK
jgi:hypothetical protein